MPSVASIPTAAKPTPYKPSMSSSPPPANVNAAMMATTMVASEAQVLNMPSATPPMMSVAGPVMACSLIFWVGL